MKKLKILFIALLMMFTFSSCETYTYTTTQDDIYTETTVDIVRSNVSFDIVIRYGTPFYYEGSLLYYIYDGLYYYPFYYNNYWYVRAYRRPFTHLDRRPYFRPHRHDYRFSPGQYRGFDRPRNTGIHRPATPNRHNGRYENNRPHGSRPDIQPRRANPQTHPRTTMPPRINNSTRPRVDSRQGVQRRNGHFGGRR